MYIQGLEAEKYMRQKFSSFASDRVQAHDFGQHCYKQHIIFHKEAQRMRR